MTFIPMSLIGLIMGKRSISLFVLTMMNLAAILSLKTWPFAASFGLGSVLLILCVILCFMIPVAFVSAELATGWPQTGGVYIWVKEAFGHRWGFLAVWLLWIENVVWYPTILTFIAGAIGYILGGNLASNPWFTAIVINVVYWGMTLFNLRGLKESGIFTSFGVIIGTLIPGFVIILLGLSWYLNQNPVEIPINKEALIPDVTSLANLAIIAGLVESYAGIEMNAIHAADVQKPQKSFPIAILITVVVLTLFSTLGTLSVAMVLPLNIISFTSGGIETVAYIFNKYNIPFLTPVIGFLIAVGALASLSTWIIGPSRGLLTAAQCGDLPPILHTTNRKGMPIGMLILQGVLVSIISTLFILLPSVSHSFWILEAMVAQLYIIMYIIMFLAAIRLRYTQPKVWRSFRVPGGKIGFFLTNLVGFLTFIFVLVIGFIPPSELGGVDLTTYEVVQVVGVVGFVLMPFIISLFKKPSWDEIQ
ncbi:MAG: amino acid permease [Chlamydiae bacterium]|nr:amino acid permease [Chlamydiota bacterium]